MLSKRKAESDNIRNNKKRSISTFLTSKEDDIANGKDLPKTEEVVFESEPSIFDTNYEDANKMKLTVVRFDKI